MRQQMTGRVLICRRIGSRAQNPNQVFRGGVSKNTESLETVLILTAHKIRSDTCALRPTPSCLVYLRRAQSNQRSKDGQAHPSGDLWTCRLMTRTILTCYILKQRMSTPFWHVSAHLQGPGLPESLPRLLFLNEGSFQL